MKFSRELQRRDQRVKTVQNVSKLIDANNSVDQLLSLLLNNFSEQFDAYNDRLVPELKNAKQHLQNLTFILGKMK